MVIRLAPQPARLTILGINSGTSADGLDMAAVTFTSQGKKLTWTLRATHSVNFPKVLRQRILDLALSDTTSLDELIAVDSSLGQFIGAAAKSFISGLRKRQIQVAAIASHGQTVRHTPIAKNVAGLMAHGTLQIGLLDIIASATGLPVVGNFRAADVALGNEGAPITVAPLHRLMSSPSESRIIVNIGGISNYFYFPMKQGVERSHGGDCGPGNTLSDLLSQKLFRKPYDTNGNHAAQGETSHRLLMLLLAQPFFRSKATSTGREEFGSRLVNQIIEFGKTHKLSGQDLLATSSELTAIAISRSVAGWATRDKKCRSIILTGGGRKNSHLVQRIAEHCQPMAVQIIDDYGLNGDYVEAASYAALGESFIRGNPSWTVGVGGTSKHWPMLGHLALPPANR